jgi:hypothetical protein
LPFEKVLIRLFTSSSTVTASRSVPESCGPASGRFRESVLYEYIREGAGRKEPFPRLPGFLLCRSKNRCFYFFAGSSSLTAVPQHSIGNRSTRRCMELFVLCGSRRPGNDVHAPHGVPVRSIRKTGPGARVPLPFRPSGDIEILQKKHPSPGRPERGSGEICAIWGEGRPQPRKIKKRRSS